MQPPLSNIIFEDDEAQKIKKHSYTMKLNGSSLLTNIETERIYSFEHLPQNKIVFQISAILFALCSLLTFWDVVRPISPTVNLLLHSLTVSAYICGEKESIQCMCT